MTLVKVLKLMLLSAFVVVAASALSACKVVDIIPNWKQPAIEIQHDNFPSAFDDRSPVVVEENGFRYVLFSGGIGGGESELFLQKLSLTGTVSSLVRLTNNSGIDIEPQMVSGGNGFLYITWTYRIDSSSAYQIWFLRVRTSDLVTVQGPIQVSKDPLDNAHSRFSQVAYNSSDNHAVVVWASETPTSTIYYNRVNLTGALTPTIVSQGPGCASNLYPQYQPRLTRSYPHGSYSQIAWVGYTGSSSDSVFWREFYNKSGLPSSDCIILSDMVDFGGLEGDLSMAINPDNNRSYVAWSHYNDAWFDGDIYLRSVDFYYNRCNIINISEAITTTDDYNVSIAAGHAISNWVHLAWERSNVTASNGAIQYTLVQDGSNCAGNVTARTPITLSANMSLGTAPVPGAADLDSPRIAVRTNALIARAVNTGAGPDQPLEQAGMTALPAPLYPPQAKFNEGSPARQTVAGAPAASEAASTHSPLNCTATPDHPKCTSPLDQPRAFEPQAITSVSSSRCGTWAADAVAVSFYDDDNDQMYAVLFQAGELMYSGACRVGPATGVNNVKLAALTRNDYVSDWNDHAITMTPKGLPIVAWVGREPGVTSVTIANDEIYVTGALFDVNLPLMVR